MKWIWKAALVLVFTLTGCAGLPQPREMGDVALLRTMGVDRIGDRLEVTVATGPRAKGVQAEGQEALILSAQDSTLSSAALTLRTQSDSSVSFGHVDQLLLGEDLSYYDIKEVLDYFARDRELGLGAQLWAIQGEAAKAAVESGGSQGIEGGLSTLRTNGKLGIGTISRTIGEVYADILELGCSYVPALSLTEEEDPQLEERGYAIFKDGSLAGYLEGSSARGLELLASRAAADVLEVQLADQGVTAQITRAATVCRFIPGQENLTISCRVWAQLVEYQRLPGEEEREHIQQEITHQEEENVRLALSQLADWGADCLGLGQKAGILSPGRWNALSENWPYHFGKQIPEVNLKVELTR